MVLHLRFVSPGLEIIREEKFNLPVAGSHLDSQRMPHSKQQQLQRLLLNLENTDLLEQCQPQRPQED